MRLLSYSIDGKRRFGLLSADGAGVIDLASRINGVEDLGALIETLGVEAARCFSDDTPDVDIASVAFERPIAWPRKIFCIGVNYGGRSAEYADPTDAAYPSVFLRFPDSLTAHERPLLRPAESEQLDYEGEIVAVIGKAGRRIAVEDARNHIAGLTLGNEGTIRDWVRHAKFNVTQGKNWDSSGSLGPWMVTLDEIGEFDDLHLTTHVNGELRQDDTPASMAFPIEDQIAYLSTFC